jgi:hypothetical protein
MIMSLTAESSRAQAHAEVDRSGSRTAPAWKRLWPRNSMRSLKEPTLIAELQSS